MAKLNNKKDIKQLADQWKKEMDSRKVDWTFIGFGGLFKLLIWEWFSKYRLIYFMQACCNGMSHNLAYRYATVDDKNKILDTLKAWGWEKI